MWMRPLKSSLVLAFSSFCKPQTRSDLLVSYVPYQHFCNMSITYMRRVKKVRRMPETLEIFIRRRDIPSCVCDDKSRYFTTKHEAFLNITKWFFCLNLPMDSHLSLSIYSGWSRCCNQLIVLSFAGRNKNGDVIFLRSEQSGSFNDSSVLSCGHSNERLFLPAVPLKNSQTKLC